MLADMVTEGNRLVDVGCDHGFLSIHLVQRGVCPRALAMDVRKGPLAAAKEHIDAAGLENYIETRLSDGLIAYRDGEADTMVCAGMGGKLMAKILSDSLDKAEHFRELILQPQSEIREFRGFLRESGFEIAEENALFEDGKYYFAIKAVYNGQRTVAEKEIFDEYGELLLKKKHPVLKDFLIFRKQIVEQLRAAVEMGNSEKATERLNEIQHELEEIQEALMYFEASV